MRELALFLGTLLYAYAEAAVRLLLPARRKAVGGELVLLTGASRGLGRATAREFARRQSRLVLWDVDTVTGCRAPAPRPAEHLRGAWHITSAPLLPAPARPQGDG